MAMKIGYIMVYDFKMNPHLTEKFKFREETFTRRITSKGDRAYSKMLQFPVDYEEIVDNANIMKEKPWVDQANTFARERYVRQSARFAKAGKRHMR